MGAAMAIAVLRRKEKEVRDDFHRAGAINPASAMSLSEIGLEETRAVNRLRRHAIIREAAPGLFYFDDDAWEAFIGMRRRLAIMLLVSILLIGMLVMYGAITLK